MSYTCYFLLACCRQPKSFGLPGRGSRHFPLIAVEAYKMNEDHIWGGFPTQVVVGSVQWNKCASSPR